MLKPLRCALIAPLLAICASHDARAQHSIYEFPATEDNDRLGEAMRPAGDVNADGVGDLIAGAPWAQSNRGVARVYSGADGAVLHTFVGDAELDYFGRVLSGAGDVNRDGFADVIVATRRNRSNEVKVLSGRDGALLMHLFAEDPRDEFGASVDGAGDFDQDGFDDVLVGVPANPNLGFIDFAAVYSGKDGSQIYRLSLDYGTELGICVRGMGDLDRDAFPELLVAHQTVNGPVNDVISGRTRQTLFSVTGGAEDHFSADRAYDVDGDAINDLIVGRIYGPSGSVVRVYSGAQGALLYELAGSGADASFGNTVAGVGDANGDGRADLLVSANGSLDPGYARLFSGRTGEVLYDFDSRPPTWHFGQCVSSVGDVDRDGLADLVVSAPQSTDAHVYVFAGNDLFLKGSPASVSPGSQLSLTARESARGQPVGMFAVSIDGAPIFRLAVIGAFDDQGGFAVAGVVPDSFGTHTIAFQAFGRGRFGELIASDPEGIVFH